MNYKITEQYARTEERFIAECQALEAARWFLLKKTSLNEVEKKKVIYRLYDDNELLQEINNDNISTIHAKYAEGDSDFITSVPFVWQIRFKIMSEKNTIAQCQEASDAKIWIHALCEMDPSVQANDLFFLVKNNTVVETLNQTILKQRKQVSEAASGGDKGTGYTLSPLSTRPTPPGGPGDYWVKREDEEEDQ